MFPLPRSRRPLARQLGQAILRNIEGSMGSHFEERVVCRREALGGPRHRRGPERDNGKEEFSGKCTDSLVVILGRERYLLAAEGEGTGTGTVRTTLRK